MQFRFSSPLVLGVLAAAYANAVFAPSARAQPATFKVAYFNIQSGKGEPGLAGRPVLFSDTVNCTDPAAPLNAWGTGFLQHHLTLALADPSIVALGLSEAWTCAAPNNVRVALGWKATSTERNGVALLARHGFAGPEEWVQLDTSLNVNPADTMWVLRRPVCVDAACSTAIDVFSAHWFADAGPTATLAQWQAVVPPGYDRQAAQTVSFLQRTGGGNPHILIGDLNTWEGSQRECFQDPPNAGLDRLRAAGYVDAWPLLHGGAEGLTGMTNRAGCGTPEGYAWKRPDYVWSPAHYVPVAISRFGVVPAGDPAPSDHYGLIAEFPVPPPSTSVPPPPVAPSSIALPAGEIVLHAKDAQVIAGDWRVVDDGQAAGGARLASADRGTPKLTVPLAAPADFFELTFTADAGRPYRLWIRARAEGDTWANDSVFVQFSGAVSALGQPTLRIGTTEAAVVNLEEAAGSGIAGWGWQDNGYGAGVLGPAVAFAASGPQTLRVQIREDGISIDQILLSPASFLTVAPGATRHDATIYTRSSGVAAPTAPTSAGDIVIHASAASIVGGQWIREADASAAGGNRLRNPDLGLAKVNGAAAAPASYVDLSFAADAGRGYRLWIRGRADRDAWTNDSVFVQFAGSVTASGAPVFRIGTADATIVNLEEASGAGLSGWGWQDNGWGAGVLGPLIYFAASGAQTIRVQAREDGIAIDQIVLSPTTFLNAAPGALKNDATIHPATVNLTATPPPVTSTPYPVMTTAAVPVTSAIEVVLYAARASTVAGAWRIEPDASAAGGSRVRLPDLGAAKLPAALAAPAHYIELTFDAEAGRAYRLWIRGRADGDLWTNDSAFVQFSGSVTQAGAPVYRIGTTSATVVSTEEAPNAGLAGWGWQDNGYGVGVLGPAIYFAATGPQTIRIQQREDGLAIDQVVLSSSSFLTIAPGAPRNDTTILR